MYHRNDDACELSSFQKRISTVFFIYIYIYIIDVSFRSIENESERMYKMVFKMKRTCGTSKEILDTDLIRIENFFFLSLRETNEKTVRDFENPADLEK